MFGQDLITKKTVKLILFLLITVQFMRLGLAAQDVSNPEAEVLSLRTQDDVEQYWKKILSEDQAFRKQEGMDSVDCLNFKRTVLMLKHHGYPSKQKFDPYINATPGIVFIHQQSIALKQLYFPLYYKAWKEGNLDTWWLCDLLAGMYRGRFQAGLIDGARETKEEQVPIYLNLLEIEVGNISYDVSPIDSLCL